MDFTVLTALRDRLRESPDIMAFVAARYKSTPCSFFIGLKPDVEKGIGIPADRFPYVAVSPLQSDQESRPSKMTSNRVSILFGVNEDEEVDGVFTGVESISQFGNLLLALIEPQPLATSPLIVWDGQAQILFDAGTQHPYYEAEIILNLESRHDRS